MNAGVVQHGRDRDLHDPVVPLLLAGQAPAQDEGVAFTEIDLWQETDRRAEMVGWPAAGRTVPQLFIDGRAIGGSDELAALEASGELDRCSARASSRDRCRIAVRCRGITLSMKASDAVEVLAPALQRNGPAPGLGRIARWRVR